MIFMIKVIYWLADEVTNYINIGKNNILYEDRRDWTVRR